MDPLDDIDDDQWRHHDTVRAHLLITYASYGLGVIMFLFAYVWAKGGSPLRALIALAGFLGSGVTLMLFLMPSVQRTLERWLIRLQALRRMRKKR